MTARSNPMFLLDEELEVTLTELLEANPGVFDEDEIKSFYRLEPGQTVTIGGGAWAEFTLRRL